MPAMPPEALSAQEIEIIALKTQVEALKERPDAADFPLKNDQRWGR